MPNWRTADILLDGYPCAGSGIFLETMLDDKHRILDATICLISRRRTEELVRRQINRAQEARPMVKRHAQMIWTDCSPQTCRYFLGADIGGR